MNVLVYSHISKRKKKLKPTPEKKRELHNQYVSCEWFILSLSPQYVSGFTGNKRMPVHSHMFLCVIRMLSFLKKPQMQESNFST